MKQSIIDNYAPISKEEVDQAIKHAIEQVGTNLPELKDKFKASTSENNFYPVSENVEWTTGFWTGEVWLAYENSNEEKYKEAGLLQVDSFAQRLEQEIDINHHDLGFLYSLSCVAGYKLTGSEKAKETAILAADKLIERYREKGQFIQAWGDPKQENHRLIIDCLLNLPLLYWATEVTGEAKYADIAKAHIKTSLNNIMREDKSTYHTYFFDINTGEPLKGVTHQGYRDGSAWARGQAWGVYGVALSYGYTKEKEYIQIFKEITDFFIEKLPKDLVPHWDFDFGDESDEPKDSSAAAIAACGMLEMAKHLEKDDAKYYTDVAHRIIKSLVDHYSVKDPKVSNGQLLHSVYAKGSPYNTCTDRGVDECSTWGDYFYFEAITRLVKEWKLYW